MLAENLPPFDLQIFKAELTVKIDAKKLQLRKEGFVFDKEQATEAKTSLETAPESPTKLAKQKLEVEAKDEKMVVDGEDNKLVEEGSNHSDESMEDEATKEKIKLARKLEAEKRQELKRQL
jgi:hypothetical protein